MLRPNELRILRGDLGGVKSPQRAFRRSVDVLAEELADLGPRGGADHLIHDLAALEDDQRRDGADPEPPQERGSPSHVAGSIVSGVLDDLIERVVATGNKEEDSPTAPSVPTSQEPAAPPPQPAPAPPAAAISRTRVP